ncbi:MAG: helix-turn-helix domain-containing protein [Candidatus Limnocylindrales bacterium]
MLPNAKPRIALLAAPETSPAILFGLFDVLSSVGAVYPDMTIGEEGTGLLDVRIVAAGMEPFRCFGAILIEPHASVDTVGDVDVVIVCDMYTPIHTAPKGRYGAEIAWLRRAHARGSLIASVCTGSVVLAEAGLLDGRTCASHWAYGDLFRREYPAVSLDAGAILVLDTEADGIITAAGVTAWQDLALHLIARLCGREHAIRTAKVHLLAGHADGQLPFAALTRRIQDRDAAVARAQAWIADNYGVTNPVTAMAAASGLAPRTFARRFRVAMGQRPIDFVHAIRIDEAKERIELGTGPIEDVAHEVGYEDPTFFRRLFKRQTGLTPAAYRRKFARIAAIVPLRREVVA